MAARKSPDWSFSTLYLVKDGLAIMLEAAGLLEDAHREYTELEAAYIGAVTDGTLVGRDFGRHLVTSRLLSCVFCCCFCCALKLFHGRGFD